MTREEIIRMAREAGFEELFKDSHDWVCFTEEIERFAALVAAAAIKDAPDYKMGYADGVAAEREIRTDALALLNMIHMGNESKRSQNIIGSAIRRLQTNAPEELAAAIRARGQS